MNINIFAKNISLTEGIKEAIYSKLTFLNKFLNKDSNVDVTIKVEKDTHYIRILTTYKGTFIEASSSSDDLYVSIETVANKLHNKLSKEHDYITNKRKQSIKSEIYDEGSKYDSQKPSKKIVKRKSFSMKPMSEKEAILQMDLLGHESFMFINTDVNEIMCLLYKRKDGNYGIIIGEYDDLD